MSESEFAASLLMQCGNLSSSLLTMEEFDAIGMSSFISKQQEIIIWKHFL